MQNKIAQAGSTIAGIAARHARLSDQRLAAQQGKANCQCEAPAVDEAVKFDEQWAATFEG
ncbi:hypothetical protein ACFWVM_15995 [Nocardia fluminea]|uniref:hypothetical protein n=1 Tax=Nocardia fluminea TaxID=134984 RepID=UPI00365165E1